MIEKNYFGIFKDLVAQGGARVIEGTPWLPEIYDLMETLESDIPFILDTAGETGTPILDLACGTGRILFPLARADFDVVGLDSNPEMLRLLERKKAAEPRQVRRRITTIHDNMQSFNIDKAFRLIVIANNSFNYLMIEEQQGTLKTIYKHLHPGGVLLLDVFLPKPLSCETMESSYCKSKWDEENQRLIFYFVQVRENIVESTSAMNAFTMFIKAGGVMDFYVQNWKQRRTYPNELLLLLRQAGFSNIVFYGDYERKELDDNSSQIVVLAKKDL